MSNNKPFCDYSQIENRRTLIARHAAMIRSDMGSYAVIDKDCSEETHAGITIDEWKRTMAFEIDDFVDYWKRHIKTGNFARELTFEEWLRQFTMFHDDRQ